MEAARQPALPPQPPRQPTPSATATPSHPPLSPLQGDGVPPTEAREFCDWLGSSAAPRLGGLPFSVCALGDK